MIITCWGSRGSIPVSGIEYTTYGGDTTCIEIVTKSGDTVIIDAGTGIRRLGGHLFEQQRTGLHLLFTHAHWDHILGFPFFRPLFSKRSKILIHSGPFTIKGIQRVLSFTMTAPHFPIAFKDIDARLEYSHTPKKKFQIGSLTVEPIPISHPNNGYGYKFTEDGKTFVFLTDNELGQMHPNGLAPDAYRDFANGADLLFHDAEFIPEEYKETIGWGHSVYTDVIDLAGKAGVKALGLFHLNQDRTDQQMNRLVTSACQLVKQRGYDVTCQAVGSGMQFKL